MKKYCSIAVFIAIATVAISTSSFAANYTCALRDNFGCIAGNLKDMAPDGYDDCGKMDAIIGAINSDGSNCRISDTNVIMFKTRYFNTKHNLADEECTSYEDNAEDYEKLSQCLSEKVNGDNGGSITISNPSTISSERSILIAGYNAFVHKPSSGSLGICLGYQAEDGKCDYGYDTNDVYVVQNLISEGLHDNDGIQIFSGGHDKCDPSGSAPCGSYSVMTIDTNDKAAFNIGSGATLTLRNLYINIRSGSLAKVAYSGKLYMANVVINYAKDNISPLPVIDADVGATLAFWDPNDMFSVPDNNIFEQLRRNGWNLEAMNRYPLTYVGTNIMSSLDNLQIPYVKLGNPSVLLIAEQMAVMIPYCDMTATCKRWEHDYGPYTHLSLVVNQKKGVPPIEITSKTPQKMFCNYNFNGCHIVNKLDDKPQLAVVKYSYKDRNIAKLLPIRWIGNTAQLDEALGYYYRAADSHVFKSIKSGEQIEFIYTSGGDGNHPYIMADITEMLLDFTQDMAITPDSCPDGQSIIVSNNGDTFASNIVCQANPDPSLYKYDDKNYQFTCNTDKGIFPTANGQCIASCPYGMDMTVDTNNNATCSCKSGYTKLGDVCVLHSCNSPLKNNIETLDLKSTLAKQGAANILAENDRCESCETGLTYSKGICIDTTAENAKCLDKGYKSFDINAFDCICGAGETFVKSKNACEIDARPACNDKGKMFTYTSDDNSCTCRYQGADNSNNCECPADKPLTKHTSEGYICAEEPVTTPVKTTTTTTPNAEVTCTDKGQVLESGQCVCDTANNYQAVAGSSPLECELGTSTQTSSCAYVDTMSGLCLDTAKQAETETNTNSDTNMTTAQEGSGCGNISGAALPQSFASLFPYLFLLVGIKLATFKKRLFLK